MKESLMYKMSYYRFNDLYGGRGQDRVRGTGIQTAPISLSTVEEAYTTENWIVRIYKVKKPDNVGAWLNVYDTNDVFSFATSRVFEDSNDFSFDTGYGVFSAHGGYFERPSFYKRLAVRLVDGQ